MCGCVCAWVYVCAPHECGTQIDQKRARSDILKLDLQAVLRHPMLMVNLSTVLCKSKC